MGRLGHDGKDGFERGEGVKLVSASRPLLDDIPDEHIALHDMLEAGGDVASAARQERQPPESPNYRLALALLKSAIDDVRRVAPPSAIGMPKGKKPSRPVTLDQIIDNASPRRLAQWARWWFENPRTSGDMMTLGWCCDALGVEIKFVQKLVRPLYGAGLPEKRVLIRTPGMPNVGRKRRVKA